jgi:SAM-dependent methyltransferase
LLPPDHEHLHRLRNDELDLVLAQLPWQGAARRGIKLLELGAGTGYQANRLRDAGFDVTALDVLASSYRAQRIFPIVDYDGVRLPIDDASIDVIFSSNVLEHVTELATALAEMRRVLKPNGLAIHVIPSPTWRVWTTFAHFPWLLIKAVGWLIGILSNAKDATNPRHNSATIRNAYRDLLPRRHGERGSVITEMFYCSARWWRREFARGGFTLTHELAGGLFYTGCRVYGARWSVAGRRGAARWLGSACRLYQMRLRSVPTSVPDPARASR